MTRQTYMHHHTLYESVEIMDHSYTSDKLEDAVKLLQGLVELLIICDGCTCKHEQENDVVQQ